MFAAKNELLTRPSGGYNLTRSLRFRSSASAYLNRTPASAGNRKTWTWSSWVKRGTLSSAQVLLSSDVGTSNTTWLEFGFDAANTFTITAYATDSNTTSAVFRDPAAWYHVVVQFDSTQATAANRCRIYVNGTQQTLTGAGFTLNADYGINNNQIHGIGYRNWASGVGRYFDGYMAEINFIDGQALTPSSFGTVNSYGVWQPITYGGSYGTNGFRLPFTNNASTTTLGYDFSPQGNNWTTNNISVTAGSTYDSMTDVPTLTSATAANFAVLNPLDKASSASVSNGNLRITSASAAAMGVRGSIQIPTSGKWYYEGTVVSTPSGSTPIEFGSATAAASLTGLQETGSYGIYVSSAISYMNNGAASGSLGTLTAGDIVQFAGDCDNSRIWIGKNNVFFDASSGTTGNPSTNTNPTLSVSPALMFPLHLVYNNSLDANFGQQPFVYSPPSGYVALNTFNL